MNRIVRLFCLALSFLCFVSPIHPAFAGEELDDVLKGFEETSAEEKKEEPGKEEKPSWWDVKGFVSASSSYNYAHNAPKENETDYRGLSRLRLKAYVEFDVNLPRGWKALAAVREFYDAVYALRGRDQYTRETLDTYEQELEARELYVQGGVGPKLDVKLGRQIVVWGKSDNIRVTDVLNPLDNREPGMVDIEDLREPLTMSRLDYYFGKWSVTGIAVHEIQFGDVPSFGSDFFPFNTPLPREIEPASGAANTEYAAALNGVFSGYDVAFYWARIFDDNPHVEITGGPEPTLVHNRITMLGAAGNLALGSWLIKTEAAWLEGLKFSGAPGQTASRRDILIGLEYAGVTDQFISIELVNRHVNRFNDILRSAGVQKDEYQWAVRYQANFVHDTVQLLALVLLNGLNSADGSVGRVSVDYDVDDSVSVMSGVIVYSSGDNPIFRSVKENDRVFLEARYSF